MHTQRRVFRSPGLVLLPVTAVDDLLRPREAWQPASHMVSLAPHGPAVACRRWRLCSLTRHTRASSLRQCPCEAAVAYAPETIRRITGLVSTHQLALVPNQGATQTGPSVA